MQVAIALGLVGIAAYISSNKTFELFILAREFRSAGDEATRQLLFAAGKATLVLVGLLMLGSELYGKTTAIIGLVAGFFMVIPSTAGTIGLVFEKLQNWVYRRHEPYTANSSIFLTALLSSFTNCPMVRTSASVLLRAISSRRSVPMSRSASLVPKPRE